MTKIEFTRLFLLNADILGVYNPLNGNHSEYDRYIDFTIVAFESKESPKLYVKLLLKIMNGGADYRNKSNEVAKLFSASRKQYKEMFKNEIS